MQPNLTLKPEIVNAPTSTYIYVEKIGDFHKVARASWEELHRVAFGNLEKDKMNGMWGMSLIDSSMGVAGGTYQAGFAYRSEPSKPLPAGMKIRKFDGGRYAKFTLKGSYKQLAEAYPLAMKIVSESGLKMRHAFFMETYLNTPEDTAEKDLVTEIFIPIQ